MNVAGKRDFDSRTILGPKTVEALQLATRFLQEHGTSQLLELVGQKVLPIDLGDGRADKRRFPVSYGGGKPCDDDLLTGRGMFYVTEQGKLMLDATSGHYQMTWGYNHPELTAAVAEGTRLGIVWDNHSNIPSPPVKMLAEKLVALTEDAGPDRALLGVCTGSVACGAALKIMLTRYLRDKARAPLGAPVIVSLAGNYHGTDIAAQTMRGMWPGLVTGMEAVQIEPNDLEGLAAAFRRYGRRVAGFWAEPIMMNREAIAVDARFLKAAQALCAENGALFAVDEIQTGFWYPEVFLFRRLGLAPDLVVVGKGMAAGFHPLSGLLFRRELDILEQYDAISTNGNASLAAFVSLCNLGMIERDGERIARLAHQLENGFGGLAREFPQRIERVNGSGLLVGLKFRDRRDALGLCQAALDRGLWLRAHAYHPGHRTVLTKCAVVADEATLEYMVDVLRELLRRRPWE
ncbi:MAG: aminotransferase class III-fold pyridoxal phosphate-dependent enzyme [Planctomycetota bacterium]